MSVPSIEFPVPFERIPEEVARLRAIVASRQADIDLALKMLTLVRQGCKHEGAQRGYNERDGSWMNPCPHCGAVG